MPPTELLEYVQKCFPYTYSVFGKSGNLSEFKKLRFHTWKSQLMHFIHTQVMELFIKYSILWQVGKCGNSGFCVVLVPGCVCFGV